MTFGGTSWVRASLVVWFLVRLPILVEFATGYVPSVCQVATSRSFQCPQRWLLFCEMPHFNGVSHEECLALTFYTFHIIISFMLCPDCARFDDFGCAFQGWSQVHPEGYLGGCDIINGVEFCTHPSERYDHASVIFPDG